MARIPREIVETVRDRTDLVEVVQRHVSLQRKGGSWVGLCPFHQERTPSFHVVPNKGFYHCFGCGASGDAFRFLMELEGLGFAEAVRELAGPAGVDLRTEDLSDAERARLRRRATLYDALDETVRWYASNLRTTADGASAHAYLRDRGLTDETIQAFGLGWAPDRWQGLLDHLRDRGIGPELAVEAGLARVREGSDGAYDAFRGRVIVPIRDERGRTIALGGRILAGDGPKYINSPETSLYRKSGVLYGLDVARRAIEQRGRAILVEGYFDVISMHQAGFPETIATCGTALTGEHAERLRRLTRRVIVVTDADEAGMRAAERALPLLERAHIAAFRLQIPDAKDPDELVRERGAEAMEALLAESRPLLGWVASRLLHQHGFTAAGKEAARDALVELLGGVTPAQATELARELRLPEKEVLDWARAHAPSRGAAVEATPAQVPAAGWKPSREAVHLLWLAVHRLDPAGDALRALAPTMLDGPVRPAFARLLDGEAPASVQADAEDPGVRRTLAAVLARTSLYEPTQAGPAVAELAATVARIQADSQTLRMQDRTADAIRAGDRDTASTLRDRLAVLARERATLDDAERGLQSVRRAAAAHRPDALERLDTATADVLQAARVLSEAASVTPADDP